MVVYNSVGRNRCPRPGNMQSIDHNQGRSVFVFEQLEVLWSLSW